MTRLKLVTRHKVCQTSPSFKKKAVSVYLAQPDLSSDERESKLHFKGCFGTEANLSSVMCTNHNYLHSIKILSMQFIFVCVRVHIGNIKTQTRSNGQVIVIEGTRVYGRGERE